MRKIIHSIYIIAISLVLLACATGPSSKPVTAVSSTPYTENLSHQSMRNKLSGEACNTKNSDWTKSSWKKLLSTANACVSSGKWAEVEELGNHLARVEHVAPWGAYYLSLAAEARGDFNRALWMAELAGKKAPKNPLIVYQQGRIYWQIEEFDKAIEFFKAAVKIDSSLVDAHLMLGKIFLRDQDFSEAHKHLQAVVTLESSIAEAHYGLAECLLQQGDTKSSLESLQKAISLSPKNIFWRLKEAKILEENEKDYEAALTSYKKIQSLALSRQLDNQPPADLKDRIARLEGVSKKTVAQEETTKRTPSSEKKGVTK